MNQLSFTPKNLIDCISYKDLIDNKTLLPYPIRLATAECAYKRVKEDLFLSDGLQEISIGSKKGIKFKKIEDKLISKILEKNILRAYRLKKVNRHQIIRDLIVHLKDGSPYNIVRLDIKKFFESIDKDSLLKKMSSDGKLSSHNIKLLLKFKEEITKLGMDGFPRGVSLSSTLAELCLQDIDIYFKKRNDVFYYSRFVDDIIIIHHGIELQKSSLLKIFEEKLPKDLELHTTDKLIYKSVCKASTDAEKIKNIEFSFLGYNFKVSNKYNDLDLIFSKKNRTLEIDISKQKVDRLKKRVIKSFISFIQSNHTPQDFQLLIERLQVITGNYPIKDPVTGLKIHTGIYYNYQHKNVKKRCSLTELDEFLRKILFSKENNIAKRISKFLTIDQRRKISKLTFTHGFDTVRYHTFNYEKLKKIKECWK